jgi:succinate dehydrogenase/fumarate reductase-like Fe-S protein
VDYERVSEIPSYKFCINCKLCTDNCFRLNGTLRGFEGTSSQLLSPRVIQLEKSEQPDR